ncbi:UDP-N-acetylmuramoyl-L-alanyl-D-glutamate--2,6-diaminopimelate ligase [Parashewanella curva]|uniref:UDP-N-acetylmuramoyl-L-alanyl-D-glutamate--2,6-diaminopimelate ligase n=1 Tax=Parashewanella curva TaxID=2338552 RepID=A0A3L8PU79_9GAMM|nr:UDP-N-acetylmuramoyl-L-alanyl-D-glutamate--2,6-diaminopimelate ligase [Parashewanella curva]RLV58951.1 UDP-N-acetylmuramoyl-L-alanyl-D-glutamate--2,6-diaminopimelate ligase [Parashewanella curva]
MLIKDLLAPWFHYSGDEKFNELTVDSRQITAGDVFVAIPGHQVDGRDFIQRAFSQGAIAVIAHTDKPEEHGVQTMTPAGPIIYFSHLSGQLSALAFQRYPVDKTKMKVIGVTGTNGKTTVTQLIAQLVVNLGGKAAVMGTVGNGVWGQLKESENTTSDAITTLKQLHEFQLQGVEICAMEVSSHGLAQHRIDAVPFSSALMNNLSRDHLDYHGDMINYAAAKRRLFQFPELEHRLMNLDDKVALKWHTEHEFSKSVGFSIHPSVSASYQVSDAEYHNTGVTAKLMCPHGQGTLNSPLLAEFNLSNVLAALAVLLEEGYPFEPLLAQVPKLEAAKGRMECFYHQGITVVVDYAHTPDALEQALKALSNHCQEQLWCVFGCGGDRDKGKRVQMAAAAEQHAQRVVITSDNPRTEKPMSIIEDIVTGLRQPQLAHIETDRQTAIKYALSQAQAGDIVMLAGKGHETYQEIQGIKHSYDERALVGALVGALA